MKICFVVPVDFIGGAEVFALELMRTAKEKAEIIIIHSENPEFKEKLPLSAQSIEMEFPRLKKVSLKSLWNYFKTTKKLKEKIEKINPDIVLTNSIRAHILATKALKKLNYPLAFFVHDFTFPKRFFQIAQKRANQIFTCSEAVKQDLLIKGGQEEKIQIAYNGVDIGNFPFKKRENIKKIGIMGRIDTWKGQDIFIESAGLLKNYDFEFFIYGESSLYDEKTRKFEEYLKVMTKTKHLEDRIHFMGFVPAETALQNLDLVVHASTEPEPFGRVIIEAMASGIPVIATDAGGASEIIRNRETGLLIEPKDANLLAERIKELKNNSELRDNLTTEARKDIEEKFSLEASTKNLLQALEDMRKSS